MTPRNTPVNRRSRTTVTELLVRNWRMCSNSRTRATVSHTSCFEVRKWNGEDVTEQLGTQSHIHPIGRMRKQIGAKSAQRGIEDGERHHADRQHVQGRESLVDEHFV